MAKRAKGGLGKGLGAIIEDAVVESGSNTLQQTEFAIEAIHPNPKQPRKHFDEGELAQLADSIKRDGLLQPILIKQDGDEYQIVAGERRWQASKLAGLETIPATVVEFDEEQALRVALVENLQRSDLNAIEEARGYKELMSVGNLTQSQVAEAVSKSRSAVANALRLLDLPGEVQELVFNGSLSAGHARAVLSIPEEEKRISFANKIVDDKLSVREAERLATLIASGGQEREKKPTPPRSYKLLAKELSKRFDTVVKIRSTKGKNKIEIEFADEEDLQRIYSIIKD